MADDNPVEITPEQLEQQRKEITAEVWGEDSTEEDSGGNSVFSNPAANDPGPDAIVPEKEPEPDPWENVSPALKKEFLDMREKVTAADSLAERLKQAENRIGSLSNKLNNPEASGNANPKPKEDAPTQEEIDAAADSEEAWEDIVEEYPVWAEGMDKRLAAERTKIEKNIQKKIQESVETFKSPQDVSKNLERMREELRVEIRHPDWQDIVKSKDYADWYKIQPADIQAKANSVKSADAIAVLDLYQGGKKAVEGEQTAAEIEAARQRRLAQSELPQGNNSRTPIISEDNMTDEQYRAMASKEIFSD